MFEATCAVSCPLSLSAAGNKSVSRSGSESVVRFILCPKGARAMPPVEVEFFLLAMVVLLRMLLFVCVCV